ncbi:UBP-type zinc finger domain-containing protein [Micromonospora sp. NPDC006766]|uniref:UBP-type zinc finger domain-containing protein n=1 Tax=Micromonospora sp. NPDC006766 TaxID=3154778 RepID=UPI0033D428C7
MTAWTVAGDADGNPTTRTCDHLDRVADVRPSTRRGCEDCLREGTRWMHLRECLECGHIGCCDNSPRRHATAHWHKAAHTLVRSYEPGEEWGWCYVDELFLLPEEAL